MTQRNAQRGPPHVSQWTHDVSAGDRRPPTRRDGSTTPCPLVSNRTCHGHRSISPSTRQAVQLVFVPRDLSGNADRARACTDPDACCRRVNSDQCSRQPSTISVIPMRYVDHMTNATTAQTIEGSAPTSESTLDLATSVVTHLDDDLDSALEALLASGLSGSLICDGSCGGTASCCIAPVASPVTLLAA